MLWGPRDSCWQSILNPRCDCDCDDYDMEDTFEVECPKCGDTICFDESIDPENLICPACGEKISIKCEE